MTALLNHTALDRLQPDREPIVGGNKTGTNASAGPLPMRVAASAALGWPALDTAHPARSRVANFAVIATWNKSGVYQKNIARLATMLAEG